MSLLARAALLVVAVLMALTGLGVAAFGLWPLSEVGQADGALVTGLVLVGIGVACVVAGGVVAWMALRRRPGTSGRPEG
ncbi:hypothetical protein [Deinococcus yunweiensis]|uniref:hypothetical protein n=1 Tax=Deinococcus yunweiensis TaxID=367282 RepID=UPI00398EA3C2